MRYDRDIRYRGRYRRRARGETIGRGEYGLDYEAPSRAKAHGYAMGYGGGALRSRGSYQAGQIRSGLNPVDEFEFEWGDGYVGGRGYGGTNPDLEHGYRVGGLRGGGVRGEGEAGAREARGGTARGGASWGESAAGAREPYGPARYGYGPYYERLQRRERPDDEIREEVEDALFYDTWVDADRIEVRVEDGVVTLLGTLPHYEEVRYAVDDAWDVDGVRGVRSELEVEEGAGRQRMAGRPRRGRTGERSETGAEREEAGGMAERERIGEPERQGEGESQAAGMAERGEERGGAELTEGDGTERTESQAKQRGGRRGSEARGRSAGATATSESEERES